MWQRTEGGGVVATHWGMNSPSVPFSPDRSLGQDAALHGPGPSMLIGLGRTLGRWWLDIGWSLPRRPEVPAEEETVMHSPCL